jgi:hypothetical protein
MLIARKPPVVSCSIAPLPTTVFIASSKLHGADQNEDAENGSQLGKRFDRRRYGVVKGAAEGQQAPGQEE